MKITNHRFNQIQRLLRRLRNDERLWDSGDKANQVARLIRIAKDRLMPTWNAESDHRTSEAMLRLWQ